MRHVLLATALVSASVIAPALIAPALAADVSLALDEVRTLTFNTPVATVYVGNPTIADITMIDARHAFVQGKGYGRTNIVALNPDGKQVFASRVNVTGSDSAGTVTLNRGAQRVTYNCTGARCEPAPVPGDGKDAEAIQGQITNHQNAARQAAAGRGG